MFFYRNKNCTKSLVISTVGFSSPYALCAYTVLLLVLPIVISHCLPTPNCCQQNRTEEQVVGEEDDVDKDKNKQE